MEQLQELVGIETDPDRIVAALRGFAGGLGAAAVGGYHVSCSDETEWESVEAFQRLFAHTLLPPLKPGRRAAFRSINLGARYEPGAIRVAEEHFAVPESERTFKLMVAKINAHVAVQQTPEGLQYGWLDRYGRQSTCCGALAAMLSGADLPAVEPLRDLFLADGVDRLAVLNDPSVVPEAHRALVAAIVNARLQAQAAVDDIEQYPPKTPTVFLILPCVTVDRPGLDTELLVGRCRVDWTEHAPVIKYEGLGGDPGGYRIRHEQGRLHVEDPNWPGG